MRASLALLVTALAAGAAGCPEDDCAPDWHQVTAALDRSVLSAAALGPDDVYLVGGGLGVPGAGALALHWDGGSFRELPTGHDETLWWVWAAPDGSGAWMVGERGLILRWDGNAFTTVESGVDATLFGVWGSGPDDVWVVGGSPGALPGDDDVVLHWDGAALAPVDIEARGVAFFKVWGASADDLWVSGEGGTLWRRRNGVWDDHAADLDTTASLLTVHGCSGSEVYVVGGQVIARFDGTAFAPIPDLVAPSFVNGVSCGADSVLVVGNGGVKLRYDRASSTWNDEQFSVPFATDFHGALVVSDGTMWAVGGNFLSPAGPDGRVGVVGFRGCPVPSAP